jgi:putative ABC transport system permease protein
VVHVGWDWNGSGALETDALSSYKFEYLRENARAFDGVATWHTFGSDLGERGEGGHVAGMYVSDDFFRVIGRSPSVGRAFLAEEQLPGGRDVAIVSDAYWRSRLGGEPNVIGRDVELSGRKWQIVGVMSADFGFPPAGSSTEILLPLRFRADPLDHGHNTPTIARLGDGITAAAAVADLGRVFSAMRLEHPGLFDAEGEQARLSDYRSIYLGDLRTMLWVLLAAVFVVLLISCANVANLLLARGTARRREMAIRATLGAGAGRIARQVLSESLVLAAVGGLLGLSIGVAGLRVLLRLAPSGLAGLEHVSVDGTVLLFTLSVSLVSGLLFGLVTAVPAMRVDLSGPVRDGQRTGASRRTGLARQALVVAESALAVMLLAGAGLLITSFAGMQHADLGFEARNLYTLQFGRTPSDYSEPARVWSLEQRLLERLSATPGVVAAAGTAVLPLTRGYNIPMTVQGRPEASEGGMEWRMVSRAYFDVMGIRLLRGRTFEEADIESGRPVVLINESFARRYWPDGDPLGANLLLGYYKGDLVMSGFEDPPREIIGIVSDVKERGPGEPARRTMYVVQSPHLNQLTAIPGFVIRAGPGVDVEALRSSAASVDPRLPLPDVQRADVLLRGVLANDRFNTFLMSVFAAIALALTAIGVFGVVSYTVKQRQSEIGVRVALGAGRGRVVAMSVWRGLQPLLVGLGLGIAFALALTRFMASMLHDVSATDPLTFAAVILVLVCAGLIACWIPARRAAGIDPVIALRSD